MTIEIGNKGIGIPSGNYVPGSGGSVDAYTKAEANDLLSNKQDVFNPIGALQLKIVTSENLVGYTENDDTITTSNFCMFSGTTGGAPEYQGRIYVEQSSNNTALDACISIPINGANNIVKIPTVGSDKLSLGYYNEDGIYIPVIASIDTTDSSYPFNALYTYQRDFREIKIESVGSYYTISRMSNWVVHFYITSSNGTMGHSTNPEYASQLGQCTYLQFNTDQDTGLLRYFQFWSVKGNYCYWGTADERLDTSMREQLNKITHVVIGGADYGSTVTYNKSDFGVYEADGRVHWGMPALISALDGKPNLLNLFSSSTTRSLVINTTDNLKVTNGELDVGTTVTTQGNTFNGANQLVQLDNSGKLPAIDGSQLTNINSSAPTNMVTTDTNQTITGEKTVTSMRIVGGMGSTRFVGTGNVRGPGTFFVSLGDMEGKYNYTRICSQGDIEVVNTNGSRWAKALDTVNFATRVLAGEGISITSSRDSDNMKIYTISATGSSTPANVVTSDTNTNLKIWTGTEAEHSAIGTKDANTIYVIKEG